MHLRFTQPQLQSFSAAVAVIGVLLYWSKDVVNFPLTLVNFVHLGSFALHFGSQLWCTFIAGFIMFRVLPREMFGLVQSYLFPAFFLLSSVMSIVTTTTYTMTHQSDNWQTTEKVELSVLCVGIFTSMVNCLIFSPGTITAMMNRCEAEKKLGISNVVGKVDSRSHRNKDAAYNTVHVQFIRWHCYCSLCNVVTLACNLIFMYFLAMKLSIS